MFAVIVYVTSILKIMGMLGSMFSDIVFVDIKNGTRILTHMGMTLTCCKWIINMKMQRIRLFFPKFKLEINQ